MQGLRLASNFDQNSRALRGGGGVLFWKIHICRGRIRKRRWVFRETPFVCSCPCGDFRRRLQLLVCRGKRNITVEHPSFGSIRLVRTITRYECLHRMPSKCARVFCAHTPSCTCTYMRVRLCVCVCVLGGVTTPPCVCIYIYICTRHEALPHFAGHELRPPPHDACRNMFPGLGQTPCQAKDVNLT